MSHNSDERMSQYCLVKITDSKISSGTSFIELLQLVTQYIPAPSVIVHDVDCMGAARGEFLSEDSSPNLSIYPYKMMSISELVTKAAGVDYFEWGDFFLLKTLHSAMDGVGKAETKPASEQFKFLLRKSEAVLRIMDSTEICVYTRNTSLVNAVTIAYQGCKTSVVDW